MLTQILIALLALILGFFVGAIATLLFMKKQLKRINPSDMIQNVMGQMFGNQKDDDDDEMGRNQL